MLGALPCRIARSCLGHQSRNPASAVVPSVVDYHPLRMALGVCGFSHSGHISGFLCFLRKDILRWSLSQLPRLKARGSGGSKLS